MKEGFWLKPTAIILGILVWLYVNIYSSNPIVREFKTRINYLNIDSSKNYRILPEAPEVKVRIQGPRGAFIETNVQESISASVDLLNSHSGTLTLPVNVILSTESDLTIVSKEPAQLVLTTKLMKTKKIPVNVNIIGYVPEGYIIEEPRLSVDSLEVTAPYELIETIKECRIDVYLDNIKRSISEYRQTYIVYENGKVETNLKDALIDIANNSVKLDIAVKEGYPEKTVSVSPEFINKSPEGRKLERVIALPDKVTITGPDRLLKNIDSIKLEEVDLAEIQKTSTVQVKPVCPNDIKVVGLNTVALTVTCTNVPVNRTLNALPLEIKGDEANQAECEVSSYSIDIEGFIDDINSIKKEDLINIISVSKAIGTYSIPIGKPQGLPETIQVKGVRPAEVTVIIREKNGK